MAVFNNGSITASVTPPQGFTGSYRYTLYKYDQSIGDWAIVIGAEEGDAGFTGTFINPTITTTTTHVFGNPGGSEENIEGDQNSWVGLVPGNYKVRVEAIGTECVVETTSTVGTQDPGDPEFTCADTSITIPNGTVGDTVTATATNGVVGTITPSEYQNGTQSYSVEITVPAGYSNVGSTLTCTASATGTPALTEFTCTDANFQVADGTTGQDVDATVAAGTLNSVSPAQYVEGSTTYTANITVPAGYSNAGATLTTCTDTATGTSGGGGGTNDSIYLLHASDATGELPGVYDITTATNYYIDANFNQDSDLSVAMSYVFDNQGSQYVPDLVEIPNITAINSTQIPDGTVNFPATSNGQPALFYMIVNQNITTDLTSVQAFADPANGTPVAFSTRKAFSWNGADWWIYNTGANDVGGTQSYNCVI